jgi:hypothetical protein
MCALRINQLVHIRPHCCKANVDVSSYRDISRGRNTWSGVSYTYGHAWSQHAKSMLHVYSTMFSGIKSLQEGDDMGWSPRLGQE